MMSNEPEAGYAFWSSPDQSFTVTYSLDQFHEIDAQVNEGYRRIPHGGIEVGGLLFGRSEPGGVRIEAFRPIECEHATGPSFALSEADLDRLQKQIESSASDTELAGLEAVGWFIAHTRTPLRLADREVSIFDRFFSRPNQITVLVKPERFQPTRFAFFVRKPDGSLETDGTAAAIILPLPGRAGRNATSPMPSIPAPAQTAKPNAVPVERPAGGDMAAEQEIRRQVRAAKLSGSEAAKQELPIAVQDSGRLAAIDATETPRSRRDETRLRKSPASPEIPVSPNQFREQFDNEPVTALTTIPKEKRLPSINEIKRRRWEQIKGATQIRTAWDESTKYNLRLVLILFVAAALGCAVGYWAYRELPLPVVPLRVHPEASGLVVTWPTEQTRQAAYAAIRVNDGVQQPLSPDEKAAGAARINAPFDSNTKIELIVQHWMRDSRGIVRYVSAIPGATSPGAQQLSR